MKYSGQYSQCLYLLVVANLLVIIQARNLTLHNRNEDIVPAFRLRAMKKVGNKRDKRESAKATSCQQTGGVKKCKLKLTTTNLDRVSHIDFTIDHNIVKCAYQNTADRKKFRPTSWYGDCNGQAQQANFITQTAADGTVATFGSLNLGHSICRIAPNLSGETELVCRASSSYPLEDDAVEQYPDEEPLLIGLPELDAVSETDPDIMIVWTKRSECRNAGLAFDCQVTDDTRSLMLGLINLAVEEANTAYRLSGVDMQLRLVHAYRHPDYAETSFEESIEDLRNPNDGRLDDVHLERQQYGADVVSLFIDNPMFCGKGFMGPQRDLMFSAVAWFCATGVYSLAHEVGHNMGCLHDRGTQDACFASPDSYNYGWRDPDGEFATLMSYPCTTGQCDNNPAKNCPRVQRFSSSSVLYQGQPTGSPTNDCARVHNENSALVASFYTALDVDTPTTTPTSTLAPTATDSTNPLTKDSDFDLACDQKARFLYGTSSKFNCVCDKDNLNVFCSDITPLVCVPNQLCVGEDQVWEFGANGQLVSVSSCKSCRAGDCVDFFDYCSVVNYDDTKLPSNCSLVIISSSEQCNNCTICQRGTKYGAQYNSCFQASTGCSTHLASNSFTPPAPDLTLVRKCLQLVKDECVCSPVGTDCAKYKVLSCDLSPNPRTRVEETKRVIQSFKEECTVPGGA